MNTYELMEEIIDLIKEEDIYKNYKESCLLIEKEENKALLLKHKEMQEMYLNYRKHLSEKDKENYRNKLRQINEEIENNEEIMRYYHDYHEMNHYLEEIKNRLFKGIVG